MDYFYHSGELYHKRSHLYIKREWRNGRWYYWYHEPKTTLKDYSGMIGRPKQLFKDKFERTYDKNGNVLSEHIVPRKKENSDIYGRSQKAKQDFRNAKYAGKMLHETDAEHRKRIETTGRNYAALMQERNRQETTYRDSRLKNRAKKWLSRAFSTKKTIKNPQTGKIIKSWTTSGWGK